MINMDIIINAKTQHEADEFLHKLVDEVLEKVPNLTVKRAKNIAKENIAYFAGYFDHETRLRVEELYDCVHPYFGRARDGAPTAQRAFEMGQKLAEFTKFKNS